jgi:predicted phosphoribosyltransferase
MIERAFLNRRQAGRYLAQLLQPYAQAPGLLVLALPRGGVPVAYEVARALRAPLDVFIVRKLGVPGEEELALGAVATGGVRVLNHNVIDQLGLSDHLIDQVTARERVELERRARAYRNDRPPLSVKDKTVLLVDDGLATGASMRAAVEALRNLAPARLVVAVPAAAAETCAALRPLVDAVICALTPQPFDGVGRWYEDFAPVSDAEVRQLLAQAASEGAQAEKSRGPGERMAR